jgi:membrane protein
MILPGRDLGWKRFFKRLWEEWNHDAITENGAALTFYGVLALFPFLIFLVALASYFITPDVVDALLAQLSQVAPENVTRMIGNRLHELQQGSKGGLLSFGAIAALWSASSGMIALMNALNRAYDVKETRAFWKTRGIGLAATIVATAMSLVAMLSAVVVPAIANWIGGPIGSAIDWLRLPIAGFLMMVMWALLYRFLPNIKLPFKILTPGSIVGVLVWVAASWGFSQYVRHFGKYQVIYGAVGGVIVFLTWMWVSSQVLLLGAEINKILAPQEKREAAGARLEKTAEKLKAEDHAAGVTHEEAKLAARPKSPARPLWPRPSPKRSSVLGALAVVATALLVFRRRAA